MVFELPTTLAASTTAYLTAQFADVGTLSVLALAAAIPLIFYAAKRILGLFPKGR